MQKHQQSQSTGYIRDSQALSGSDRRKFAASCILTKVQGRIWPVRCLDNKLFMKRYVREALPRLNGDEIDRSWVPIPTKSRSTSCQVWERRQFKSGRDKLSCLDSPVYQQTSFFKITKSMDRSVGYFPTDSLKKKKCTKRRRIIAVRLWCIFCLAFPFTHVWW